MKLHSLRVDGFGRLADRSFAFGPELTVIVGANETGKSTLGAAIVAALYGLQRGEKDRWRPWGGESFGATLVYETADGAAWEVRREFDKDGKGIRVYDADGADAAARLGEGTSLSPGEAHLGIGIDVFVQTACARQRAVALDPEAADAVSASLARALGGGPREDAALGALARLDVARKRYVGSARATKKAPLRALRADEEQRRTAADEARAALERFAALRTRVAAQRVERDRESAALVELDRAIAALRAAHLRDRLESLREYRDDLAELQQARAAYDDVAAFPLDRLTELEETYHAWRAADALAQGAAHEAQRLRLDDAERPELTARRGDAGRLDDAAVAAARASAAQAEAARTKAAAAASAAAAARRDGVPGRTIAGALLVATIAAFLADVGIAIAHLWLLCTIASGVAFVLGVAAFSRVRARSARAREAETAQRLADAALAEERAAADAIAAILAPLGIASIDELVARRERWAELSRRDDAAAAAAERAAASRAEAAAAGERFDRHAAALAGEIEGDRTARRAAVLRRAARRREREGLDAHLAMLTMRRAQILGDADEFALQQEYDALLAAGIEPAATADDGALAARSRERAELERRLRDTVESVATLEGELRSGEAALPDVAALDEEAAQARAAIARLEAFESALTLAAATIERHKDEAHRAFARRLEQYAAGILGAITGGRYAEIHVDPATLAIRARVPETRAIEPIERLSAGTRDQIALVVRFAAARMFAEGIELPPLLLDDPFAFWDDDRLARGIPVLVAGAREMQTLLFTASRELAAAAQAAGAARIDLEPAAATV